MTRTEPSPTSAAPQAGRTARRRPALVVTLAVAAVLGMVLSGVGGLSLSTAPHSPPAPPVTAALTTPPPARPTTALPAVSSVGLPTPTERSLPSSSRPATLGGRGVAGSVPDVRLPVPAENGGRPTSWGNSPLPPGALLPGGAPTGVAGWGGGGNNTTVAGHNACVGIWPWGGQSQYASWSCYGADETGIAFYSDLPGSGGNISWNLTLPTDRSPTLNQTDLYDAIWIGMPLTDPDAWMDACYLELQLYPDSSWYAPGPTNRADTVYGQWIGEAVAWQIEASTGYEDPCFIAPLFLNDDTQGPAFLNMSQGDHLKLQLSGWPGDPYGENITLKDVTNGEQSDVNLYNRTGDYVDEYTADNHYLDGEKNYPLDPAYYEANVENSLAWTPGGELPVTFAFEIGHGGNPSIPENNPYGGCSPGTLGNPSTPCPSYDPGSWINDTLVPWQIGIPQFTNGSQSYTATQVTFSDDLGALNFIDDQDSAAVTTACEGVAPSGWCDYPWYSYSCSENAFNYGATDWAATSDDFGQDHEWPYQLQSDSAGLNFYPPMNYSIPTCGHPSYSVSVGAGPGGASYFLSKGYAANTTVNPVGAGNYPINAVAPYGAAFDGWTTTGSVSVSNPSDSWTNLIVAGSGSVWADFSPTAANTTVTFDVSAGGGSIDVVPGFLATNLTGTDVSGNGSLSLSPGTYTVLAVPGSGQNFSHWGFTGGSLSHATPHHLDRRARRRQCRNPDR
jgi:hypothetical protein